MSSTYDPVPAGYSGIVFGNTVIYVPRHVADDQRERALRRYEKQNEAMDAEASMPTSQSKTEPAPEQVKKELRADGGTTTAAAEPFGITPGWVRVMTDPRRMFEFDADPSLRTPDREVRERLVAVKQELCARGPMRRMAMPYHWREALDELEAEMPNFRAPIQSVRNVLCLMEATGNSVRVPPMLLVGPPGLGKTRFSHRLARVLTVTFGQIAYDQPTAGTSLTGSDAHWSNTHSGKLFNLICMGDEANPVVALDELDKAASDSGGTRRLDPLGELHSALEPETARKIADKSTGVVFDASYVTYVATANSINCISRPLLSRFEIFEIGPLDVPQAMSVAAQVVRGALDMFGVADLITVHRRALCMMAHLTPRMMHRVFEKALGAAMLESRFMIGEDEVWKQVGFDDSKTRLH